MSISIHAPAGGATSFRESLKQGWLFQFTPLREGRQKAADLRETIKKFQFTPLREGRLRHKKKYTPMTHFNSRPCGRGDLAIFIHNNPANIFQFTPLREGRPRPPPLAQTTSLYFNSRPCGRGDAPWRCGVPRPANVNFNSRPCGRGDSFTALSSSVR